jgi:hypothetical protein
MNIPDKSTCGAWADVDFAGADFDPAGLVEWDLVAAAFAD